MPTRREFLMQTAVAGVAAAEAFEHIAPGVGRLHDDDLVGSDAALQHFP